MLIIIRIYAAMKTRSFQKASDFSMEKCSKKKKKERKKKKKSLQQLKYISKKTLTILLI